MQNCEEKKVKMARYKVRIESLNWEVKRAWAAVHAGPDSSVCVCSRTLLAEHWVRWLCGETLLFTFTQQAEHSLWWTEHFGHPCFYFQCRRDLNLSRNVFGLCEILPYFTVTEAGMSDVCVKAAPLWRRSRDRLHRSLVRALGMKRN